MKVLIVEPGQYPREADIEPTLEAKQKIVGGLIDVAYPFPDDNVCVVLNDEGKLMGLPLNRALGDYDGIAGTFFVCGYNEENFVGLTPEQFTRYEKFYHDPQLFHRTPFGILVEHCTTERYAAAMDAVSRPRRPPSRQAPER